MSWKAHSLGSTTLANMLTSAAEILGGIFDSCVADTVGYTLTLVKDGKNYTVGSKVSSNNTSYNASLFVNEDTGAFIISQATTTNPKSGSEVYSTIYCALLEIQTDETQTELLAIRNYSADLETVFSTPFCSSASTSNSTNFITLVPLVTQTNFTNAKFRPVVGLLTSNVANIAVGATINISGQPFLCVAPGLFVKL